MEDVPLLGFDLDQVCVVSVPMAFNTRDLKEIALESAIYHKTRFPTHDVQMAVLRIHDPKEKVLENRRARNCGGLDFAYLEADASPFLSLPPAARWERW